MNRNEFIAKLQMVYVGDKDAFNEIVKKHEDLISYACDLEDEICNLNGENQRLKECCTDAYETGQEIIKDLEKENQRLNNVLNELEKWLKEQRDYYFEYYYYSDFNVYGSKLNDVLDKLNELKESDK